MRQIFSFILVLALCLGATQACANSYLEMITQKPEGYETQSSSDSFFNGLEDSSHISSPLWYDSRITTPSPVVFSSYPKYLAWQKAKARENVYEFDEHEFIQNMIYGAEGGLAIFGLYQIYKYH